MKNILIIGGSSGIGKSLAHQLESTGHEVIATFNKNKPENASKIKYHHLDVTSEEIDLDFMPESLDGLVYCPGSIELKPLQRIKDEDFVKDFNLQVLGAIKIIKAALSALKKSDQASIILFSTIAVQTGFPFHSMVATSKGAIEGLTRSLAAELAPKIRVNCIAPSITDTPLAASLLSSPEKKEANAQRHPLKAIGSSDDIASMASFLLTNQARWITGQIIKVDGGVSGLRV
ncbi:MAG TPA: SDR family oxidoreductase [Cyclobacteriaceae bacterium]